MDLGSYSTDVFLDEVKVTFLTQLTFIRNYNSNLAVNIGHWKCMLNRKSVSLSLWDLTFELLSTMHLFLNIYFIFNA